MNQNTVLDNMIETANKILNAFFMARLITDQRLRECQELITKFQNQILSGTLGNHPPNHYYQIRRDIQTMIQRFTLDIMETRTQQLQL